MKILCDRQQLSDALINVSKAVSTKSNMPILEGILIKAYEDKIFLCGYNLEMAITTEIPATIFLEGSIVLNARLFSDIVRKIDSTNLAVSTTESFETNIKGDITEFSLTGLDPSEYPELPSIQGDSIATIPTTTFKSMIEQTIFSVALTDHKPVHTGILFEIQPTSLTLIAVDGFRLALRRESILQGSSSSFIVPNKPLSEISKFIKEDDKTLSISINKKNIIFQLYNYTIISRLLEGEFLDYKNIIDSPHNTEILVSTKQLLQSIDRASLIINDRVKSPVIVEFTNKTKLTTFCKTSIGQIFDEIECSISGEELKIGFNNKYMIDALKACFDEKVKIFLNGPLSPIKIMPIEGDEFLFLVLPVRLQDE